MVDISTRAFVAEATVHNLISGTLYLEVDGAREVSFRADDFWTNGEVTVMTSSVRAVGRLFRTIWEWDDGLPAPAGAPTVQLLLRTPAGVAAGEVA